MSVLEEHVSLARESRAVAGEGDDSNHSLQNLVREERVGLHPLQNLHPMWHRIRQKPNTSRGKRGIVSRTWTLNASTEEGDT